MEASTSMSMISSLPTTASNRGTLALLLSSWEISSLK